MKGALTGLDREALWVVVFAIIARDRLARAFSGQLAGRGLRLWGRPAEERLLAGLDLAAGLTEVLAFFWG